MLWGYYNPITVLVENKNFTRYLITGPRPTPPRNVTAMRQGDRGILVRWNPPVDPPVPVFWYVVEYLASNSMVWRQHSTKVLASGETQLLMEDMPPGVYQLRVLAYSVLAFSQSSNIITIEIPSGEMSRCIAVTVTAYLFLFKFFK